MWKINNNKLVSYDVNVSICICQSVCVCFEGTLITKYIINYYNYTALNCDRKIWDYIFQGKIVPFIYDFLFVLYLLYLVVFDK